jgi:alpha-tubulin suppressor-like RCC1 family protein
LGNPRVEEELLPKPVEALRGVRVGNIAATRRRSYAVADTGELWAWGCDGLLITPLGHVNPLGHVFKKKNCPIPKPMGSLRDIKVDAVEAVYNHTLTWADDGSVYAWCGGEAVGSGSLGLSVGASLADVPLPVDTPQRILALRVACGV